MSLWCILGLKCGPALQRVASLSDYSPTCDPPRRLPVPLGMANRAELWPSSSRGPVSQCPLDSTHRRPNKQTRGSNFMPRSLGGVPATGFSLFIYSRFRKAPLGMFEVEVLGSQTVCGRGSDSCLTSPMQKITVYARIWLTPKAQSRREKRDELDRRHLSKCGNFWVSESTIHRLKRPPIYWEKVCANHRSDKKLKSRTYKELL